MGEARILWDRAVVVSWHNLEVITSDAKSVNVLGVALTEMGQLVRDAKYEAAQPMSSVMVQAFLSSSEQCLPVTDVFYIPYRDSTSVLAQALAEILASIHGLPAPLPAIDWCDFPLFRKGCSMREIATWTEKFPFCFKKRSCLIVDDTTRTGSTLSLASACIRRRYAPDFVGASCVTAVLTTDRRSNEQPTVPRPNSS